MNDEELLQFVKREYPNFYSFIKDLLKADDDNFLRVIDPNIRKNLEERYKNEKR